MSGAVSSALEQELLGELRRQGVVVWLDKDKSYTGFVDDLIAKQAKGELPTWTTRRFELPPFSRGSLKRSTKS